MQLPVNDPTYIFGQDIGRMADPRLDALPLLTELVPVTRGTNPSI